MRLFTQYIPSITDLLSNPIFINAILFYEGGIIKNENWGDDINYHFLKEIVHHPIAHYNHNSLALCLQMPNYLVIGSTIQWLSNKRTIVWGAGMVDDRALERKPRKVLAVRGPLTREVLLKQGIECPAVYGDPALLVSQYFPMDKVEKKYELGIINHVSTTHQIFAKQLQKQYGAKVISLKGYKDWKSVVREICECKRIMSSSLHGLIIAESYGIPNVWFETQRLIGGHFKFHDFFQSIGVDRKEPLLVTGHTTYNQIDGMFQFYKRGHIDLQPLIDSSPFELLPMDTHRTSLI